jgi:hypothetical protein
LKQNKKRTKKQKKVKIKKAQQNKMKTKKIYLFIFIILVPLFTLKAEVDLLGYFENRFFVINNTEINWSDLDNKFKLGDYNRLRLKLQATPSEKVTLNLAIDFFSFHGMTSSPFGTNSNDTIENSNDMIMDLDRAYADIHFKKFDLSIGKQRVAMGVSYLWSPLDIFNRVNLLEPKEEKPGVNAFKLYIPLGDSSSITGVFSPEDDFQASKSGLRIQTQALGIDMALTAIRSGNTKTSIYGLDFRGENFIGWWIECAAFLHDQEKNYKTVLGYDYTFPIGNGLYWLNEFFYDTSGEENIENYNYELLSQGERFSLGRTYYLSMLRYGFSELLSGSLTYIANWDDGSYILNPNLQYEIFQDTTVSMGFYLPLGKEQGEFTQAKNTIFFVWLKLFF